MIAGHLDDAQAYYDRALRLTPTSGFASDVLTGLAHLHICRDEHEAALDHARRALAINESFVPTHWMVISASGHLGRLEEAGRQIARLEALSPGITIARIIQSPGANGSATHLKLIEGLRLAGMREA